LAKKPTAANKPQHNRVHIIAYATASALRQFHHRKNKVKEERGQLTEKAIATSA
jgi:hypothetical protein